jgi:hypothetical protein
MDTAVSISAQGDELRADAHAPQIPPVEEIVATIVFTPDGRHVGKQIIWNAVTRTFSKPPKSKKRLPGENILPTYYTFCEFVPALPAGASLLDARLFIRQQLLNIKHGALVCGIANDDIRASMTWRDIGKVRETAS